uniref:Replication initiator protein n=1 Tax=Dulem virus 155 TaxID=3145632 RepID=A0AAU8AVS3_9VIRU
MSCYHPILAYKSKTVNPENGKCHILFSYPTKSPDRYEPVRLPCGQCLGCRIEYSRQWANRCMLELQDHDSAFFCTFTYDNDHVPISYYADPETGEALPSLTLRKRDFQLLMKRIRKHFPDDHIRFFACGEYGGQTFRPHYHAIIYGLHLHDLVPYKTVREGGVLYTYYNSESLSRCWRDLDGKPIGFVVVGEVTWESCAYTARYVVKKLKGKEAEFYEKHNIEPEFSLMSRKPGIARSYYDTHPDLFKFDFINISTEKGGKKFRPPRYFEKLFELDFPDEARERSNKRSKRADEVMRAKLSKTNLDPLQYLAVEEGNFEDRLKPLRRNLV